MKKFMLLIIWLSGYNMYQTGVGGQGGGSPPCSFEFYKIATMGRVKK